MYKRGISTVIATVIMIALVLVAVTIVWTVVNKIITENVKSTESCFGILDKVAINNRYTCYDAGIDKFQFSINVGDIELDDILVSIGSISESESFKITEEAGLSLYGGGSAIVPDANSGLTYLYTMAEKPDSIKLAPIINENQCEVSDSLHEIDNCSDVA